MTELSESFDALRKERRAETEPERMNYAMQVFAERGWRYTKGPDAKSFTVFTPNGRFNFWPYSGWFAGATQGRGIKQFLKAADDQ